MSVGKVQFSRLPLAGVHRAGVTSAGLVKVPPDTVGVLTVGVFIVGLVRVLFVSVWVHETLTIAPSAFAGNSAFIQSKLSLVASIASVFVMVSVIGIIVAFVIGF